MNVLTIEVCKYSINQYSCHSKSSAQFEARWRYMSDVLRLIGGDIEKWRKNRKHLLLMRNVVKVATTSAGVQNNRY